MSSPVVVLDFETTGMSPDRGDRITEVGAVRVEEGRISARFQSLVNAGVPVPPFITRLTGITTAMLRTAPPLAPALEALAGFIGDTPLVAHNASFDRRFLDAEFATVGRRRRQDMLCSVLLARRLLPEAPSYQLGRLVQWAELPSSGVYHRALADAEMTAQVWLLLHRRLRERYGFDRVPLALLQVLQHVPAARAESWLRQQSGLAATASVGQPMTA